MYDHTPFWPLFSAQTYEAATVQLLSESLENQNNGFSMARRDNDDGPTGRSPHFFKIILPNVVQEGKLVSMLKFIN